MNIWIVSYAAKAWSEYHYAAPRQCHSIFLEDKYHHYVQMMIRINLKVVSSQMQGEKPGTLKSIEILPDER